MTKLSRPTERPRERVLVCGVVLPGQSAEHDGPLGELRELLRAAEAEPVGAGIVQYKDTPDPATLLGKGKVAEIKAEIDALEPDAVAVDNDLSPGNIRNLEKAWGVRVLDRSEVILDIFAKRARTAESRLQVELAQAEYLLPRLKRMWTHLERMEGAVGTRGPGETQLETDKRLLRKRVLDLKRELKVIAERRQREVRSRHDQFTIGLVGYTNAGKSTLLNKLTGSEELAADMLFATLDTRTRQWRLPDGRNVLLSDTVGFLQRLPHHLVASFHATLEETLHADLLLHVVDASHPDASTQIQAVDDVLDGVAWADRREILVFNKTDRVPEPLALHSLAQGRKNEVVFVSAETGAGLERLTQV
ncbi:MAG TPA: GTPase HflX, partial [Planctomycetota bacterium]|nr:GTPase HflX [Planctomycetota bacterium]